MKKKYNNVQTCKMKIINYIRNYSFWNVCLTYNIYTLVSVAIFYFIYLFEWQQAYGAGSEIDLLDSWRSINDLILELPVCLCFSSSIVYALIDHSKLKQIKSYLR